MRSRTFYGWYVVAAAHVLLMVIFGASYSFGALFAEIEKNFSADRFAVATVFSITTLIYSVVGVFAGSLADHYSTRGIIVLGVALLACGFFLSSFASDSLLAFLTTFCLFVGLGIGLVYVPTVSAIQRWFVKRRSTASGLALAGTGIGTFVAPNAAGLLLQALTWQEAMRVLAVAIALAGMAAGLVVRSSPSALGLSADGEAASQSEASDANGMSVREAFNTARFWWYFGAILFGSVGLFTALVHVNPFAQQLGITSTEANLLIGFIGIGNVAGRLFLGSVGDRIGTHRLLFLLTICLALLHGFWLTAHHMIGLSVFALFFGAANGGCISLYPAVAAEWFGTKYLGSILGTLYVSVGLAAIGGGSVAGLLYDHFSDYTAAIALSGCCAVLSAIFLILATGRHNHRSTDGQATEAEFAKRTL